MNNIITAAEVQKGDRIRASVRQDTDRAETYEGVANHFEQSCNGHPRWRTLSDRALFTDLPGAVIELLDRPKPKIVLPTGLGAVVEYQRFGAGTGLCGRRVATLHKDKWRISGEGLDGSLRECDRDAKQTPEQFAELLNSPARTSDFKVLFEGVAK